MGLIFCAVAAVIACGALAMGGVLLRRALRLRAAWRGGLTAEARCLRAYTTTSGGDSPITHQHHVYEFTTGDGRQVRVSEEDGPATIVEGDIVVLRYAADAPERATAKPYRPVALAVGMGCVALFVLFVVGFCVFFAVTALAVTSEDF
ncbi:DUF3592 domain-containing protein [Streptomyces sp. NPDC059639]|uniref:DUF3592 domain-containing protein n=1 Tax=Streptomyces sp. NPDC059639 TaxID=3346891 RepID=UPI00367BEAEC